MMLLRKAARAIWANKRSYIACVFLIAIGITMFLAMNVAGDGLGIAVEKFYRDYRMADVFVKVEGMPSRMADSLAQIEGVDAAEARYVYEARVEVAGSEEIITLRLITWAEDSVLNRLLIEGSPLADDGEILVNPTFFTAHGMQEGDPLSVFAGGKEHIFYVCGTAMSPEYAYITRGGTDLLPDESGFGIGYITIDSMARLTGSAGIANDVVFGLAEGYAFDDVRIPIEDALAPYGIKELIDKEDQISFAFLQIEVEGLRSVASALPMVFVLMATLVLYLMMKRVIEQDRTQIGTLKAMGFSKAQILLHYLTYGGITGLVGGMIGFFLGQAMSGFYMTLFLQFFLLPEMTNDMDIKYIIGAFILAVGGGVAGSFFGAFKTLRLTPSEAMRPENPKPVKHDVLSKLRFLPSILTSRGNMALRGIARNWLRSSFVVIGVVFSFGLLSVSGNMGNMVDKLIMSQFTDIQIYEVKVPLLRPAQYDYAVEAAYGIDYVTRAEGLLELPAQIKHKHLSEGALLTGVDREAELYRIADTDKGVSYPPPQDGLILSNSIANTLHVEAGDIVTLSSPFLDEDVQIPVVRVIEQNLGGGAYMELDALAALFDMPKTATSVLLNTDDLPYLKEYMKGAGNTATLEDKVSTLHKYQDMMGMYSSMYLFMQIMSVGVAFAIIYNTATISLSERKREYATLRVLGMTIGEVCEIMNFEYWILCFLGMVVGVPFTNSLNKVLNLMMDTSLMSVPSTLPASSYAVGVVGCVVAVMLSNRSAKGRIKKFDMVEVLKERD
ncbi:MAG: ABC transporter permease [Clostridiales bacterium]|nr:ABC transporter permease [Clostridiales bacterium]